MIDAAEDLLEFCLRAGKLARIRHVPAEERATFAYGGMHLRIHDDEFPILEELESSSEIPEGWRGQSVESLALCLMWTDLSADGALLDMSEDVDQLEVRRALAAFGGLVRKLRADIGGDVDGATPTTFEILERCEERLAFLDDAVTRMKMQRAALLPDLSTAQMVLDRAVEPESDQLETNAAAAFVGLGNVSIPESRRPPAPIAEHPVTGEPMTQGPPTNGAAVQGPVTRGPTTHRSSAHAQATRDAEAAKPAPKTKPKRKRVKGEARLSATARRRLAIVAMVMVGVSAWTAQTWLVIRSYDDTRVRPPDYAQIKESLPSAMVLGTNAELAFAKVDVGSEWRTWGEKERQLRAVGAVRSLSSKGYKQVDLIDAGGQVVAVWRGGLVQWQ